MLNDSRRRSTKTSRSRKNNPIAMSQYHSCWREAKSLLRFLLRLALLGGSLAALPCLVHLGRGGVVRLQLAAFAPRARGFFNRRLKRRLLVKEVLHGVLVEELPNDLPGVRVLYVEFAADVLD